MLVEGSSWKPDPPEPRRRRPLPRPPWRPFAWLALVLWLLVLAAEVGGLAGYGLVLAAVSLGSWRLDRYAARWEWGHAGNSGAWR